MKNVSQGNDCSSSQPTPISALRCAILAVLIGNPLFTEEEQLLANHLTHECEDTERLARWLRNVRRQDAKRGILARNLAAIDASQQAVCLDEATHRTEMDALLRCQALDKWERKLILGLMTNAGGRPGSRLLWLGHGYLTLLENLGRLPQPKQGFSALQDN